MVGMPTDTSPPPPWRPRLFDAPVVLPTEDTGHRHHIEGTGGLPPIGTFGVCDCGKPIIWRGSRRGHVAWHPMTWRERVRHRDALLPLVERFHARRGQPQRVTPPRVRTEPPPPPPPPGEPWATRAELDRLGEVFMPTIPGEPDDRRALIEAAIREWMTPGTWQRADNGEELNARALAVHVAERLR